MRNLWNRLVRRLRRLFGLGWSAREFRQRYAGKTSDAWGYQHSPDHQARADRILKMFVGRQPQRMLELGCAEGFLTRHLSGIADRVVACDVSEVAVHRAAACCADLRNVHFMATDIRHRLPDGPFDACLASDVLYYLSPREIQGLANRLSDRMPVDSILVLANEWNVAYTDLTSPTQSHDLFVESGCWYSLSADDLDLGAGKSHFLGVLRRS